MSGHSKWATTHRKKEATDAKRASVFTKLSREISVAVKEGGPNPDSNSRLKDLIAKAKANNIPNDNVERLVKRLAGGEDKSTYEDIIYEGYGPCGVAVMAIALTDNRNRTAGDVRHYFDKCGGNLGQNGSVSFMFDKKGVIIIDNEEGQISEDKISIDAVENSGGFNIWHKTLKSFYTSIDSISDDIKKFFTSKDIENYTIKVHALKSSARIIGADKLSLLSEELERLGKQFQKTGVHSEQKQIALQMKKGTEKLIPFLLSYKQILKDAVHYGEASLSKSDITPEQLRKAAESAVCKINIDSDSRLAMTAAIRKHLAENPGDFDPRQYLKPARENMKKMYIHKIVNVLGSNDKLAK